MPNTKASYDDYLTLRDAWIATHPAMRAAKKAIHAAQNDADLIAKMLGDLYAQASEPPFPDEGCDRVDVLADERRQGSATVEYLDALRVRLAQYDAPIPLLTPAVSVHDGLDAVIDALPPLVEHDFELPTHQYAGDNHGIATLILAHDAQVIKLTAVCPTGVFVISQFHCGGVNLLLSGGGVSADMFAPGVRYNTIRATITRAGWANTIIFCNRTDDPTPQPITLTLRVRSRHTRDELLPPKPPGGAA